MIGRMQGKIIDKQPPYLLLEIGGIGYEIANPMTLFPQLPELHQETILHTHLVIREEAHQLYGFYHPRDRDLFRALIKVNGVGPKLALTILSGIEPMQLVTSILQDDLDRLTRIPGIGKKTAARLLAEMKEIVSTWSSYTSATSDIARTAHHPQQHIQDAISALTALGYKSHEAQRVVAQVQKPDASSEELVRLALKQWLEGAR